MYVYIVSTPRIETRASIRHPLWEAVAVYRIGYMYMYIYIYMYICIYIYI